MDKEQMKQEIYTEGPIVTSMLVFKDLIEYKSGVYHHVESSEDDGFDLIGSHAVLLVGWGQVETEEAVVEYWEVKNSWGADWGMDGYFRIKVGECYIADAGYDGAFSCKPILAHKETIFYQ